MIKVGYLTAYPDGAANPHTAALNFASGQTVASAALVPVGSDGAIELYNAGSATVHLSVNLTGAYAMSP